MTPLAPVPARLRHGLPGLDPGGVQRADAPVAAADGRARRPQRSPRPLPRRSAAALHPGPHPASASAPCWPACSSRGSATSATRASVAIFIVSLVAFVVVCEHLLPMLIVRRDPEEVLDVLLPAFHPIAKADAAADADADRHRRRPRASARRRRPTAARTRLPQTPAAAETSRRGGRDLGGGGPRAAAVDRRLHRDGRPRGDDAAPRHRRHPRRTPRSHELRDALPRGAVLAHAGLPRQPRQHRRHRLREGSRGAAAGRRAAADDADAVGVSRARRASACRSC